MLLAALTAIFLWEFHRTEVIETRTTLQGGQRIDVLLSLQSTWRWQTPDRIVDLRVLLDGAECPVDRAAYYGLGPVDPQRKPLVFEIRGYPEIVIQGSKGGPFAEIRFRFENYSFSERRLITGKESETKYYAMAPPPPAVFPVRQSDASPRVVTLGPGSIKAIPRGEGNP